MNPRDVVIIGNLFQVPYSLFWGEILVSAIEPIIHVPVDFIRSRISFSWIHFELALPALDTDIQLHSQPLWSKLIMYYPKWRLKTILTADLLPRPRQRFWSWGPALPGYHGGKIENSDKIPELVPDTDWILQKIDALRDFNRKIVSPSLSLREFRVLNHSALFDRNRGVWSPPAKSRRRKHFPNLASSQTKIIRSNFRRAKAKQFLEIVETVRGDS
jgi:hypothetical protein